MTACAEEKKTDEKAAFDAKAALNDPSKATLTAPDTFKAKVTLANNKGSFTIDVTRDWAPKGADRFYNLIQCGFYDDIAIFRVIDGFMAQFGIHGDPALAAKWRNAKIQDDAKGKASNTAGMVTFATAGPNTRTTQMFINFGNNANLDGQGFTPFGKVSEGMDVVNKIYKGYGDAPSRRNPNGKGPNQGRIQSQGNKYLKADFPKLDYIKSVEIVK